MQSRLNIVVVCFHISLTCILSAAIGQNPQFQVGHTWNLNEEWSDQQNPNGVWDLGSTQNIGVGEWGTTLSHHTDDWTPGKIDFGFNQPAWVLPGCDAPGWARMLQDTPEPSRLDFKSGDVLTHGWSMVHWVSPVYGEILFSVDLWKVRPQESDDIRVDIWLLENEGWIPSTDSRRHPIVQLKKGHTRDHPLHYEQKVFVDQEQHVCLFFGAEPPRNPGDLAGCRLKIIAVDLYPQPPVQADPGDWRRLGPDQAETNISVQRLTDWEICYTSGRTRYVESLMGDRWVSRYWTCEGRSNYYDRWSSDAFQIGISDDPAHATPTLLSRGWHWCSSQEVPSTRKDTRQYVVALVNRIKPVSIKINTLLDGTPVITRWLDITNESEHSIALLSVNPWCSRIWERDAPISILRSIRDDGTWEGWVGWQDLKPGINDFSNSKGLAYDEPFFVLRNHGLGEYIFGQLAWPVSYEMKFLKQDGLSFSIGPSAKNSLRVLAPHETITTPAVHFGYTKDGFDGAVQSMHKHIRHSILPERPSEQCYRVQYLMPEDQGLTVYRGRDYNETNVLKAMEVAAAVGVELFIVDGPTWAEGYGNWVPKKAWFPNGFTPLSLFARKKNILFGVYAEPEGGRGDWSATKVWKEQHQWFKTGTLLDLSQTDALDYMRSEWKNILDNLKVRFYRHDLNTVSLGEGTTTSRDGFTECDYWRHYEAFYSLTREMQRDYPDVIFQQASGGGTRLDLATASCWDEQYTSDRAMMPYLFQMASGMSVFLPPEILVTPNGMQPVPNFDTLLRGIYTLGNTPMIFNGILPRRIEDLTPELKNHFLHYDRLFKSFMRPMLSTCRVFHHAPVNASGGVETGPWFAMEFTSPDQSKGWATIIRLVDSGESNYTFIPRGLSFEKDYRITFDSRDESILSNGHALGTNGLTIALPDPLSSELLLFETK